MSNRIINSLPLALFSFSSPGVAATINGQIHGQPQIVQIMLTHTLSGNTRVVNSDAQGHFSANDLSMGFWSVEITTPGLTSDPEQDVFIQSTSAQIWLDLYLN